MPMTQPITTPISTARETIKQFARTELGLEIGEMEPLEALVIVVAALITSRRS